jgi:hypothetical protein
MAASRDPALGPKARALAAAQQPPARRIVKRTIVVRKVHDPGVAVSGQPGTADTPPAAAPAAAPAPTPAPPPAPVVTKVS